MLLGGVLMLTGSTARAGDWMFADFGMTPEQVALASGGKAKPCPPDNKFICDPFLPGDGAHWYMEIEIDGADQLALFKFDPVTGRLKEVAVSGLYSAAHKAWFEATRNQLRQLYGSEKRDSIVDSPAWKWKTPNGEVWMPDPPETVGKASFRYVSFAAITAMHLKPFDPAWPPTTLYAGTPLAATRAVDPAFCQSFIRSCTPQGLDPARGATMPVLPGYYETRGDDLVLSLHIDIDNDDDWDLVHWTRGMGAYFRGEYMVVIPGEVGPADLAAGKPRGDRSVEDTLNGLRKLDVTFYSGAATLYASERDVHFLPIRRDKQTYLWVWPTKAEQHPLALLYRPAAKGKLDLTCAFDRD
jgi:hypothetical protein